MGFNRAFASPPQVYARLGGALYLIIFALGFTLFAFPSFGGGPAAAQAVLASEGQLRVNEGLELVLFSVDVPLALIFYVLLRPVDRNIALLAAFFRLANAFFGSVSVLGRLAVLALYGNAAYRSAFTAEQARALASMWLSLHLDAQEIGLMFFGVHCILLGTLIYRSGYLPKFIGVLLPIAGALYIANGLTNIVAPAFAAQGLFVIFLPGFAAEVSLCLWLLIKGVDTAGWRRRQEAVGIAPTAS